MESCKNCKHVKELGCFDSTWHSCSITLEDINFPRFMGGSKKCECYERSEEKKNKFVYPTKEQGMRYNERKDV